MRSVLDNLHTILCMLVALLPLVQALPVALPQPFNLYDFIHDNFVPEKGDGTVANEIQCYSLPYGGIGFASHILTYWTVVFLALGKKPLPPFTPLRHSTWDFLLAIVSVLVCVPLAAFTIVRCLDRWQFVLIAVWKTTMSFTLAVIGLHRSVRRHKQARGVYFKVDKSSNLFGWLVVYGLGTIVGFVGLALASLVAHTWVDNLRVRIVTYVFGGVTVFTGLVGFLMGCLTTAEDGASIPGKVFMANFGALMGSGVCMLMCTGVLAALYSDWTLGAISGTWSGAPSGDNEWVYWSYFTAKRSPLLSL